MPRTTESVQFNPSSGHNTKKTMAFKFVLFAALLAVANAGYLGAPATLSYAAAPAHVGYAAAPAVAYAHAPLASTAVGSHTQSVYRSHDGNHAVSTYSKAVDTAFSSVRKYDTRVSNDAVAFAHAPVAYSAPAYATYAAHAPAVATTYAAHAPAVAYSSPAYATYAAHAPAVAYSAGPAYAKAGLLGVAYSAAPAVAHISYSNGAGYNYHY